MYNCFKLGMALAITSSGENSYQPLSNSSFYSVSSLLALMAFITFCYPLAGFMADVCCGYYRMVTISLILIWAGLLFLTPGLLFQTNIHKATSLLEGSEYVLIGAGLIFLIPGLSGFYSNVMQLSLDQLLEAPSHMLGVFLHWSVWVDLFGGLIIQIVIVAAFCSENGPNFRAVSQTVTYFTPGSLLLVVSVFLIFNCFTRRWFVAMETQYNPYKMVLNILRYVRANKHPKRHSALHWTNDEPPSRFDFAKECYGGPFSSNQVEDVKTLGRVICVLLSIGPVFILSIPTSNLTFSFFTIHTIGNNNSACSANWVFIGSGTLGYIIALLCLPLVMWIVYCLLKNRVPRILTRLEIGMVLSILGVLSMLLIDYFGHTFSKNKTKNHCVFTESFGLDNHKSVTRPPFYSLDLPWYVMLVPNALNLFSYNIVLATSFEFVSAQTPQPMKGLVFGVLFAIKGGFLFLGAIGLFPFSLHLWSDENTAPSSVSCGFGYLLVTLLASMVGLFLFSCVRRRYKYRMRDEEPFPQSVVEEIYERRLQYTTSEEGLDCGSGNYGNDESDDRDHSNYANQYVDYEDDDRRGNSPQRNSVRFADEVIESGRSVSVMCDGSVDEATDELLSLSHDWYGTFSNQDKQTNK